MNTYANLSRRKYDFFYLTINTLQKGEIKKYPVIFEGESREPHSFSDYLNDSFIGFSLKKKSYNTITNFHLKYIIMFLNFVFNDSKTPIDSIDQLTIEMVQEFVDKYCQGAIGKLKKEKNYKPNKETVSKMNTAITYFVYWLCWKKNSSKRRKYKMKFISVNDFSTHIVNIQNSDGNITQREMLNHLVEGDASSNKNVRRKVVEAEQYTIEKLVEIALHNDPMMAFGIILGAYAGLRQGYVTQMHEGRLRGFNKGLTFKMSLDFNREALLRDDGQITSHLKRKCDVPIYPGCAELIYTYYQIHLDVLRSKGFYPNKYGALFVDNRGNAMTRKTYMKRFDKLVKILEVVVTQEANMGIAKALREQRILSADKLTHHSLRHYFKQLIERMEGSLAAGAYYMAQRSIKSQLSYAPPSTLTESVRRCQAEAFAVEKLVSYWKR